MQNNVKIISGTKAHNDFDKIELEQSRFDWQIKFRNFRSNRMFYARQRVGKKAAPPIPNPTKSDAWKRYVYGVCGVLPVAKLGIYIRGRANRINLTITAYCSITWFHLEHCYWVKDFYSWKMITEHIQVDSARCTLYSCPHFVDFSSVALTPGFYTFVQNRWPFFFKKK